MEPKICPYLCLIDDDCSHEDTPNERNACYRAKPPVQVALSYQKSHCLTDAHTECPGFINGWENGFPESLRFRPRPWKKVLPQKLNLNNLFLSKWFWLGLLAIIVLSFIAALMPQILSTGQNLTANLGIWLNPPPAPTATIIPTGTAEKPTQTASFTATATIAPSETPSPTFTLTSTPTLTLTPPLTPTYTSTPGGIPPFIYLTQTDEP